MTRRLLLGYLTLTAFILIVLEVPLGITFARFERSTLRAGVRRDAAALALASEETLQTGRGIRLQALADQYRLRTGGRVVIVDAKGDAQADSEPLRDGVRNFLSRPEVAAALAGREAVGHRYSSSLKTDLLYVATPVASGREVRGAVRITYPESFVDARVLRGWIVLGAVGLTVLAFVMLLSIQLARSVTRPVRELEEAAVRLGDGQLDTRVAVPEGPPELQVLARSFNETASKLQGLVDQQRRFAADASHQLRTPLAALRLRLENMEAELALAGGAGAGGAAAGAGGAGAGPLEDVEAAIAEVHRLSRLVDGLLALARAEGQSVVRAPVDLTAVVAESASRWGPLIEERSVSLVTDAGSSAGSVTGAGSLFVLATPGHLEQVIDNLVANAVEVAPPGSVVTVQAAAVVAAGPGAAPALVELHVLDEGPGMTPEQRAAAFARFWRSSEGRSQLGGSGLGLSIVQRLVEHDGGSVELLEAPGGGLDACVRLECAPVGGASHRSDQHRPPALPDAAPGPTQPSDALR